ncbi:MAG: glycosyltransferase [Ignavibacteriae bacterium]|nr:glycosyltransferase [Ignavibacteriota bacterium]
MLKYLKLAYSNSNISIVSALKIKEKYQNLCSSEIIVIPNGHNIKINKSNNFEIPSEILQLNGPIIGFIGTLFRFIDEQLLEFIISKRPNYNFVFVGHTESNFPIDSIKRYNNVHLLGPKEKSEIPKYINSFDLCLNPFKVHEVNDSVSPVKVFEYLAMKKLIISTNMYSLRKEKVADYIIFADNYEQYLNEIDKTLTLTSKINNVPDSILENYSWDNLFAALVSKINSRNEIKL